jgi:hypothetical protein
MTLGRLELLRYMRTWRAPALVGVHAFLGLGAPMLVRYERHLLESQPGVIVDRPPPTAVDGMIGLIDMWSQLGLIVVLIAATTAFSIDQYPGTAALLRSTRSIRAILLSRFMVTSAVSSACLCLAWACGFYEVLVLLGRIPNHHATMGLILAWVYLMFVVCIGAAAASITRGRASAVSVALSGLIAVSVLGGIGSWSSWFPGFLLMDQGAILSDGWGSEHLRAAGLTSLMGAALLALGTWRLGFREARAFNAEV